MDQDNVRSLGPECSETWLRDSIHETPSTISFTSDSVLGSSIYSRSSCQSSGKGCGRKGAKSRNTGFLQPFILSSEEKRHLAPYYRSVDSKSLCRRSNLQDGKYYVDSSFHQTRRLGSVYGSDGRLLSCPDPSQISEVPQVLCERRGIPISGSPFRDLDSSQSFHQTHGDCRRSSAVEGFVSSPVFRRLASSPTRSESSAERSKGKLVGDRCFGSPSQPREIRTNSVPRLRLCGNEFSDSGEQGKSSSPTRRETANPGKACSGPDSDSGPCLPVPDRGIRSGLSIRAVGQTTPSANPILPQFAMETNSGFLSVLDSNSSTTNTPFGLVVGRRAVEDRSTTSTSNPFALPDFRRQSIRMGSPLRTSGSYDVRSMVSSGIHLSHQQPRTESSSSGNDVFQGTGQETLRVGLDGQHNSSLLHSQTGGDTFFEFIPRSSPPVRRMPFDRGDCLGQTSARQAECFGRRAFSPSPDPPFRVDTPSGSGQSDFLGTRSSDGGPVCNSSQPSATLVCLPSARPSSLGSRRHVSRLASSDSLCVPTVPAHSSNLKESQECRVPIASCGSSVASEILVQRPSESSVRSSKGSTLKARSTFSKGRSATHQPRSVQTSRLALIRKALRQKHFSARATTLISQARRQSTSIVYDAKWRVFNSWCVTRQIDPLNPSVSQLADFFVHLFDDKNLAVSTIKGYRSMLSQTLSFIGLRSIGSDNMLSELMKSFENQRPVSRSLIPNWDLTLVLKSLTKAPYEPLSEATLQAVTWKTVFLLGFATAKRRSELHALSSEDGFLRFNADGSVTLLSEPGFLAKTQLPSVAPVPINIPSLSAVCGDFDIDRLLCPVRSLKFYLNKVKSLRGTRKRLFIPLKGKGDITAASISRWIASVVRKAYSALGNIDPETFRINAHELRALSTSWAYVNHTPLDDILKAAFWRNSSTFSSFYLRTLSLQKDDLYMLGPLVASQTIITPCL